MVDGAGDQAKDRAAHFFGEPGGEAREVAAAIESVFGVPEIIDGDVGAGRFGGGLDGFAMAVPDADDWWRA